MREISVDSIRDAIEDMCIRVCHELSDDMKECLFASYESETSDIGKKILGQLKENLEIAKNEMIPIYLRSDDPELVLFGQTLMERSLSPHVFRHWFTVQLVLSGINNPGILMKLRGDSSPESALTYIDSKGDLLKQYSKITNETFNYTLWAARKKHNEGI